MVRTLPQRSQHFWANGEISFRILGQHSRANGGTIYPLVLKFSGQRAASYTMGQQVIRLVQHFRANGVTSYIMGSSFYPLKVNKLPPD